MAGVETSTRKVAICAVHFLHDILRALISEIENRFLDTFARAIDSLAGNARRAHLNGIDNVGGCNSVWSQFLRILNYYITYEGRLAGGTKTEYEERAALARRLNAPNHRERPRPTSG